MKKLMTLGLLVLSLSACTSTQTTEYYTAVQNAAIAQSKMMQARYDALGKIAGNGGEASTAAVMALAMTSQTPIVPQTTKIRSITMGTSISRSSSWIRFNVVV